ncbi:MAG: hypothetical protein H7145_07010 [Akkermansiaceae bacterium]|nr:hypothetical protein [Armatimonadota bacterium]
MSFSIYPDTRVTDDCGVIGIVDVEQYHTFIGKSGSHEEFMVHIHSAIEDGIGLVWGTGREDVWRISIRRGSSNLEGYRSFESMLHLHSGNLLVLDFDTMLVESESGELSATSLNIVETDLNPGSYICRVIQMYDHSDLDDDPNLRVADFVIELQAAATNENTARNTKAIPWL